MKPALSVTNCDDTFSMAFHFIKLRIFSSSLVKDLLVVLILVCHGAGKTPHGVTQANCRSHVGSEIHRRKISILVSDWSRRMYLFKVNLMTGIMSVHAAQASRLFDLQIIDHVLWG